NENLAGVLLNRPTLEMREGYINIKERAQCSMNIQHSYRRIPLTG
ncbi:19772_t:CDS:1, partial [Gigaspora rosea]